MSTRRSFLQALGMAAGGLALAPALAAKGLWYVPKDFVSYDGPITIEWILAESVACLAAALPVNQFNKKPIRKVIPQLSSSQLGVDASFRDSDFQWSREQFKEHYLTPAMHQLASTIRERKATTCYPLAVPHACEYAGRFCNEEQNFDLRFVRAYDPIGHIEYVYDDETGTHKLDHRGEPIIAKLGEPRWINRWDILVS